MKKRMLTYLLGALMLLPLSSFAQLTLTDGASTLEFRDGGLTDFNYGSGDIAFQYIIFYRINGEAFESQVNGTLGTVVANGNTGSITFLNVDGKNFDLVLEVSLTDMAGGADVVSNVLVTNNTGAILDIDILPYLDLDKGTDFGGDEATLLDANTIEITDVNVPDFCRFIVLDADAFQVTEWDDIRTDLQDGALTDLDNSGLPFGPGDFTGAFQKALSIPVGGTATVATGFSANNPDFALVVPTMSQWGLFLFALLMVNLGLVFMYRQERTLNLA